jgi:hypothetical protein
VNHVLWNDAVADGSRLPVTAIICDGMPRAIPCDAEVYTMSERFQKVLATQE